MIPRRSSSSRLSPFKTYREFVADQRDDGPQAFARDGEYRGGFARSWCGASSNGTRTCLVSRPLRPEPRRGAVRKATRARRRRGEEVPRRRRQGGRGRGQAGVARPQRD